jgi:hypothetical protein
MQAPILVPVVPQTRLRTIHTLPAQVTIIRDPITKDRPIPHPPTPRTVPVQRQALVPVHTTSTVVHRLTASSTWPHRAIHRNRTRTHTTPPPPSPRTLRYTTVSNNRNQLEGTASPHLNPLSISPHSSSNSSNTQPTSVPSPH